MGEEEQLFYYKNGNAILIEKEPLTDLGEWQEITKKQYEAFKKKVDNALKNPEISDIQAKKNRIAELKGLLSNSDYQAVKFAEGWISEEDYAPIKAQRQAWREEINELEQELEEDE